jgi:F420-non-reducing hydrogenase iron-sulfur subunit
MTIKRIAFLQELLAVVGLEGRLHLAWISSAEAQKFAQVMTDFTEKIRALGPNPLSGGSEMSILEMTSEMQASAASAVEGVGDEGAGQEVA